MSFGDLFGGGGDTGRAPAPPVYPLNLGVTDDASRKAGLYQWNLSQDQYAKQYPGIVAAQEQQMKDLNRQLTGPLDPTLQRSFMNNSEAQAMSAFGGGSETPNITGQGSIGRNTIASGVASQTQGYQDYLRDQQNQMIGMYPMANMPNPQNMVGGAITNLTNQTNANREAAGYQASSNAANAAANAQGTSAAIGAGTAIASSALQAAISSGLVSW